jgi:hypothetical protein
VESRNSSVLASLARGLGLCQAGPGGARQALRAAAGSWQVRCERPILRLALARQVLPALVEDQADAAVGRCDELDLGVDLPQREA